MLSFNLTKLLRGAIMDVYNYLIINTRAGGQFMRKDTSLDSYYFHQGTNYQAYRFLGCNVEHIDGKLRYYFRPWAPNAISVGLISDFTGWDNETPLERVTDGGVWELVYDSETSLEKQAYKFRITSGSGAVDKGDP